MSNPIGQIYFINLATEQHSRDPAPAPAPALASTSASVPAPAPAKSQSGLQIDPAKKTIVKNVFTGPGTHTDMKSIFPICKDQCGTIKFEVSSDTTELKVVGNNITVQVAVSADKGSHNATVDTLIKDLVDKIKGGDAQIYILSLANINGTECISILDRNKLSINIKSGIATKILTAVNKEFNVVTNNSATSIIDLIEKIKPSAIPVLQNSSVPSLAIVPVPNRSTIVPFTRNAPNIARLHAVSKEINVTDILATLPLKSYVIIKFVGANIITNDEIFNEQTRELYIPVCRQIESNGVVNFRINSKNIVDADKNKIDKSFAVFDDQMKVDIDIFYVFNSVMSVDKDDKEIEYNNIYPGHGIHINNVVTNYISNKLAKYKPAPKYYKKIDEVTKLIETILTNQLETTSHESNQTDSEVVTIESASVTIHNINNQIDKNIDLRKEEINYLSNVYNESAGHQAYLTNLNKHNSYSPEVRALFKSPEAISKLISAPSSSEVTDVHKNNTMQKNIQLRKARMGNNTKIDSQATVIINYHDKLVQHTNIKPWITFKSKCILCLEFKKLTSDQNFVIKIDNHGNPIQTTFIIDISSPETISQSFTDLEQFTQAYKYIYISFAGDNIFIYPAKNSTVPIQKQLQKELYDFITGDNKKHIIINDTDTTVSVLLDNLPNIYVDLKKYMDCYNYLENIVNIFIKKTPDKAESCRKLLEELLVDIKNSYSNIIQVFIQFITDINQLIKKTYPEGIAGIIREMSPTDALAITNAFRECDIYDRTIFNPDEYELKYNTLATTITQLQHNYTVYEYYTQYLKDMYKLITETISKVLDIKRELDKSSTTYFRKYTVLYIVYKEVEGILPKGVDLPHITYELLKSKIVHQLTNNYKGNIPKMLEAKLKAKSTFRERVVDYIKTLDGRSPNNNTVEYWDNLRTELNNAYQQNLQNIRTQFKPIFIYINEYSIDDITTKLNKTLGNNGNEYSIEKVQQMGETFAIYDGFNIIKSDQTLALKKLFTEHNITVIDYNNTPMIANYIMQYDFVILPNGLEKSYLSMVTKAIQYISGKEYNPQLLLEMTPKTAYTVLALMQKPTNNLEVKTPRVLSNWANNENVVAPPYYHLRP
jgi:hypothetical protein